MGRRRDLAVFAGFARKRGSGLREIASKQQLRLAFLRWAVVTVPFVLLLGFTSARLAPSGSANAWYATLAKPPVTPPDWAFPTAWTAIYVMLGLALAMIIHARGSRMRGPAITVFALQLVVNLTWSPVFFGMHQVTVALGIVVAMFVLTLAMTVIFWGIRVMAGLLLVPYLAWLVFAGYLNYQIMTLNPDAETLAPSATATQIIKL